MEKYNNRLKNSGKTLENDTSSRLPTRPAHSLQNLERPTFNASKTNAVNDSNSKSGSQSSSESRGSRFKPVPFNAPRSKHIASSSTTVGQGRQIRSLATKEISEDDDDDDEFDFLSGNSQHGSEHDPASSQKPVLNSRIAKPPVSKTTHASTKNIKSSKSKGQEETTVIIGGKEHHYHPAYLPNNRLKGLSFKKKKPEDKEQDSFAPSSTSLYTSILDGPISKENQSANQLPKNNGPSGWDSSLGKAKVLDLTSPSQKSCDDNDAMPPSPLSGKSANSNRTPSSSSGSHFPPSSKSPYDCSDTPRQDQLNARLKMRPRPIPKARTALDVAEDQDYDNHRRKDTRSSTNTTWSRPRSESVQIVSPKRKRKGVAEVPLPLFTPPRVKPASFPVKVPIEDSLPRSKPTNKTTKSSGTSTRAPKIFPMFISGKPGQAKDKPNIKDKGKTKKVSNHSEDECENEGEDSEEGRKKPKPKAFPLSNHLLPSTSTSSGSRSLGSSRAGKRSSEAGSGDERSVKKSRKGLDKYFSTAERPVASPNRYPFDDEGDSMSFAPRVDPSTLCPFCDTPLPSEPSPLLTKLIEATIKKARRDPRPTNPLGLKAPLTAYITLCQRHRFESQILPEAESKGWPKTIKWKKVGGRVLKMKNFLKALIEDPGDDPASESGAAEWEVLATVNVEKSRKRKKKGPKAKSIFWVEFMDEVKKKGLRAVSGVRGQFASFEKAQPGYYGEMGSVIIHQTLYNMFPPTDIDPILVSPLTPTEFVQRILVPEVALHLIMEDRDLEGEEGVKKAFEILRDSSTYGVAMFPEDSGESGQTNRNGDQGKMGAGDMIVMERARKRRKELAEEEVKEEEERKLQEEEERIKEQEAEEKSRKEKKSRKEMQKTVVDSIENNETVVPPRPRPRPIPKKPTMSSLFSASGTDEDYGVPSGGRRESETDEPVKRHKGSPVSSISSDREMDQDQDTRRKTRSRSAVSDQSDLEDEYNAYNARRPSSEEMRRSPSASESRILDTTVPTHYSRAPSRDMSRLSLECDSESSNGAVVDGEGRQSRSKSRLGTRSIKRHDSEEIIEVASSDSEVDAKTPIPKRMQCTVFDDDDTPRPAPTRKEMAPLALARLRKQKAQHSDAQHSFDGQKTGTSNKSLRPVDDEYDFIFSSSSSQSR